MKRKIYPILASVLFCICAVASSPSISSETVAVLIKRLPASSEKHVHRMPAYNEPTFDCSLITEISSLYLTCSQMLESTIVLSNITTGQSYEYNTTIGVAPLMLYLFGEGQYVITITLASGQVYEGEFIL